MGKKRGEKRKVAMSDHQYLSQHKTELQWMLHLDENILQGKTRFICLQFGSKCDFQSDWNSQSSEHVTGNATQNTRPSSHVRESLGTRPYTCSSYSPQGNIKGRPSSLQTVMCTIIFIFCTKLLHSHWWE